MCAVKPHVILAFPALFVDKQISSIICMHSYKFCAYFIHLGFLEFALFIETSFIFPINFVPLGVLRY